MFDSEDVIASTAGMIADVLFKVEWALKPTKAGERTPSDRAMLLLKEHSDTEYLKQFKRYLWLRDQWAEVPLHEVPVAIIHYTFGMIGNLYNSVYNSRLHLLGNSVSDEQVYRAGDPNINGSTDPTPAQLAKDHDNHPFHTLAGATAASYLVHPYDTSWQDQTVRNWAQAHPNQVKRGESSTEWEALRKEHEQEIRENIKKISNMSQSTWDYLNKNYEVIFGEKNKVKR